MLGWTAARHPDGYGAFSYIDDDGRCIRLNAHRWLLGHLRGEHLGPDEESCDHCDNPPCVTRHTYESGPHQENMDDRNRPGSHLAWTEDQLPAVATSTRPRTR